MCHNQPHETSRDPGAAGSTAATSHRIARFRGELVFGRASRRRFGEFASPMVSSLPSRRIEGALTPTHAGAAPKAVWGAAGTAGAAAATRTTRRRIRERAVDAPARGRFDRGGVWRLVSSLPRPAALEEDGVELPEARTPRPGTGRGRDRALAPAAMAAYKKTPGGKAAASSSLTKAASCSNRWCAGHGRRKDRRRFFRRGIATTDCRSSAPSHWLHNVSASVSTGTSRRRISGDLMWWASCDGCVATSAENSSSSWTDGTSIGRKSCASTWTVMPQASAWSGSLLTPRTSILPSRSGTTPSTATWPTSSLRTGPTFIRMSKHPSPGNADSPDCCGRSSKRRS